MVFLHEWDQSSPRRTCQFHLIEVPVHPLHAQKSIDAGPAYYGQGVYVKNLNHDITKLRLKPTGPEASRSWILDGKK